MAFVYDRKFTIRSVIENLSDAGLPEGEPEIHETGTMGVLVVEGEKITLTYREKTEGGLVSSSVVLENGKIAVQRRGAISFDMHFGDEDYAGIYRMEPYAFDFKLHTLKIRNRFEKSLGSFDIFYLLNIGGADKKVRFSLLAEEP